MNNFKDIKDIMKEYIGDDPILFQLADPNFARKKFAKNRSVQYSFYCNKLTDKDVILYLSTIKNKRKYFINLVRKDIEKSIKN